MFEALQNFLSDNQFGKSYSEIDRNEQAELELHAQRSTSTSGAGGKLRENQFASPAEDLSETKCDDRLVSTDERAEERKATPALQFHAVHEILSDSDQCS